MKTFQAGSAPRSTAFNAHRPSKPAARSELARRRQAKLTALGKYLFCLKRSGFCSNLLAPNQTTSSRVPPLLPFSGFQRVTWNKLHQRHTLPNHLRGQFFPVRLPFCLCKHPCIFPKQTLNRGLFVCLFFPNTHCLNFLPKSVLLIVR